MSEFDPKPHIKKLLDQVGSESYEDAIATCNFLLGKNEDPEVLLTKVLCHLEEGLYKELLEFLQSSPNLSKKFCFEYVYCQFCLKQHQEAVDFIRSHEADLLKENKEGKFLIEAQVHFCLGNYSECVKIYEHLIHKLNFRDRQIYTNYIATLVLSKNSKKAVSKEIMKLVSQQDDEEAEGEDETMYELFFNIARAHADTLNIEEALNLLGRAKTEHLKSSDRLNDSLLVLEGYISQISGDEEQARDLYDKVIKGKSIEQANVGLAVAGNNLVSIYRGNQSVYEVNRRLKFAFSERVAGKLTTWQERGIYLNKVLWLLQMKNFDGCEKMFEDLEKNFPGTDIPTLIHASLAYKKKDHEKAIQLLKSYLEKNMGKEEEDREACANVEVSLSQIYLNKGMARDALSLLRSCSVRHYPSVVGCVIGMYRKMFASGEEGITSQTKFVELCFDVFNKAIQYWFEKFEKSRDIDEQKILVTLLNANAEFLFSLGRFDEAVQTYERIIKMNPRDANRFKACLVNVLVGSVNRVKDASQGKELVQKIRNLSRELPKVDIPKKWNLSFLETINVRKVKERKADGDVPSGKAQKGGTVGGQGKKKKKRKNPKPKNFEPSKDPDPERWLPKWERSGYKKAKKRWQGARVDDSLNNASRKKKQKKEVSLEKQIEKKMKGKGGKKGKGGRGKKKRGKKRN